MKIEGRRGEKYTWGEIKCIATEELHRVDSRELDRQRARERLKFIDAADCVDGKRWRWASTCEEWEWLGVKDASAYADERIADLRLIAE